MPQYLQCPREVHWLLCSMWAMWGGMAHGQATQVVGLPEVKVTAKAAALHDTQPTLSPALADWLGPVRLDQQAWSQSVLTDEVLLHVNRLEDALAMVPGAQVANDGSGTSSAVMIRGFKTTALLMGGLPEMQWRFARDPYTADRLEVLRGPQGVMLGQSAPGGSLHWVPKLANGLAHTEVGTGLDSEGWGRAWLDLNTPWQSSSEAGSNRTALIGTRLVLSTQDGHTQAQSLPNRRTHALASLRVAPSDALVATAWLEYQDNHRPWLFGTAIPNETTEQVRYDQLYVVRGGLPAQRETTQGGLMLQSQISANWQLSGQWREGALKRNEQMLGFYSTTANPQVLSGYYARFQEEWLQSSSQVKAVGQWQGTAWSSQLALGADVLHASRQFNRLQSRRAFSIDVDANDYSGVNVNALPLTRTDLAEQWHDRSIWLGNQMTWQEHTRLTWGLRQGHTQRELRLNAPSVTTTADQATQAWQAGLSHDIASTWTLYGSWGTATQPNTGHSLSGDFLPALQARQTELGLHLHAAETRHNGGESLPWQAHIAAFQIDQNHLTTPDPADPNGGAVLPIGRWQTQGIELSGEARVGAWTYSGQLTHQVFKPIVKTSATMGDTPVGALKDFVTVRIARTVNAAAWLPRQWWAQLQAAGPSKANATNTVGIKGYERLDLGAQWRLSAQGTLTLNLRNLTDRRYVEAVNGTDDVYQGTRRGAWFAANWRW